MGPQCAKILAFPQKIYAKGPLSLGKPLCVAVGLLKPNFQTFLLVRLRTIMHLAHIQKSIT
jgi:hypothetical protein